MLAKNLWYMCDITDKPRPRPKAGQARPTFRLLAWPGILQSPSRLKPGQSRGFQAKPEPAHHYSKCLALYPDVVSFIFIFRGPLERQNKERLINDLY